MRSKQKLFAGLASLTLFDIAAASAADMPVKAPVRPVEAAAVYNWSGAYIGGHIGYRWADAKFRMDESPLVGPRDQNFNLDGGIAGVHAGFNVMLSSTVLVGLEGDWSWGSASDRARSDDVFDGFALSRLQLGWQATIRGRLGLVSGASLFYVTGGVAFTEVKWKDTVSVTFGTTDIDSWSYSKTRTGWVVGAGIEHMLSPNWLIRAEYLYEHFGKFDVPAGFAAGFEGTVNLDEIHKVRVGISYKFGGPVVARY